MGRIADLIYNDLVARGKDEHTAKQWRTWMWRFEKVCGEKDSYTREDVLNYVAGERKRGYCQNTINTNLRPVRLLADLQGWDYPKLNMKKVRVADISRPIFERKVVEDMIRIGRGVLNAREMAMLALSTTYGLRREEMCCPDEPEISEGKIGIHTIKGGEPITQLIPDEIEVYLRDFRAGSISDATQTFTSIIKKTGIVVGKGYGWHSIRRSLATELMLEKISGLNVVRFMRWSDSLMTKEFGMLSIYAHREQGLIDSQIFEVHPFLAGWSDKPRTASPVSKANMTAVDLTDEEIRVLAKVLDKLVRK